MKDGSRLFVVRQKSKDLARDDISASPTTITNAVSPEEQAWWTELRRFLHRHFTKENAELVLQEYKKVCESFKSGIHRFLFCSALCRQINYVEHAFH